jgi:hypothetical protein
VAALVRRPDGAFAFAGGPGPSISPNCLLKPDAMQEDFLLVMRLASLSEAGHSRAVDVLDPVSLAVVSTHATDIAFDDDRGVCRLPPQCRVFTRVVVKGNIGPQRQQRECEHESESTRDDGVDRVGYRRNSAARRLRAEG